MSGLAHTDRSRGGHRRAADGVRDASSGRFIPGRADAPLEALKRQAGAPSSPSRTRLTRPQFYTDELTGSLPPDARDLIQGLSTRADDEGWLIWRPAEIAANLYAYEPPGQRLGDLARRAQRLEERGLLVIEECGCALLPTLRVMFKIKGGMQSAAIWDWHRQRHESGLIRIDPDVSGSSSSSSSALESSSSSSSVEPPGGAHQLAATADETFNHLRQSAIDSIADGSFNGPAAERLMVDYNLTDADIAKARGQHSVLVPTGRRTPPPRHRGRRARGMRATQAPLP